MSPLIIRLQDQLRQTSDPALQAELMVRIACSQTRSGMFEEAQTSIIELRKAFGGSNSGRTLIWVMLAEGLIHQFSDSSVLALDRISRAQVLSLAMKHSDISALASAWKAHIEFDLSRFDKMVESLNVAVANAAETDYDSLTRIAMVICNSFMICGDWRNAQHWFVKGREYALKNGDQASIEAMVFNRAVLNFSWLRIKACGQQLHHSELKSTRMEVESARNFQNLTRSRSLSHHIHFCEARLLILEEEFEQAIERLKSIRNQLSFANNNFDQAFIDLEICYCLLKLSDLDGALASYSLVGNFDFAKLDVDEQLVALWIKLKLSEVNANFGDSHLYQEKFNDLMPIYKNSRQRLLINLASFAFA